LDPGHGFALGLVRFGWVSSQYILESVVGVVGALQASAVAHGTVIYSTLFRQKAANTKINTTAS